MPNRIVYPIDLCFHHWPESIASFLVIGPKGPVLIEAGPTSTLPRLLNELARFNVSPSEVQDVLVTHIHLDHAGAAGWWARQGARIHVHHFGAPHLIDPSKLLASAQRIYKERMTPLWGDILPALPERVNSLRDGDLIRAGGLEFKALGTPGHARHHMIYCLDNVAFTGDIAGIQFAGDTRIQVPTVPPEFDLEAWRESIRRMVDQNFTRLYLTHFGPVDEVQRHLSTVNNQLGDFAEQIRQRMNRGNSREEIVRDLAEWWGTGRFPGSAPDGGVDGPPGLGSLSTYVDGVMRYWDKRAPSHHLPNRSLSE